MRTARLIIVVLVALAACRDGGAGSGPPSARSAAAPSARAPAWAPPPAARTTSGAIAVKNLDAQIQGAETLATRRPEDVAREARLVGMLLDRGGLLGRFADLEHALARVEALAQAFPDRPEALVARARARSAVHRFQEALADLDKAESLGEKAANLAEARAGALEGLGRFEEVRALRHQAREARATLGTLAGEAALLGEMGRYAEAEALFAKALAAYRDVSPFPVAWVRFQHGVMWERAGELDRARLLFADAVARLPLHAHAAAHLATLEPPGRAVELLESVAGSSDDPEILAQLAEARRLAGAGDGAALLAQARERFTALEQRLPLAVADHAGWFWLGPGGDPARAVALARRNVEARPTGAAYELLVEALGRAGQKDEACAAAEQGMKLRYGTLKLLDVASRAYAACRMPERADEVRRALRAQSEQAP